MASARRLGGGDPRWNMQKMLHARKRSEQSTMQETKLLKRPELKEFLNTLKYIKAHVNNQSFMWSEMRQRYHDALAIGKETSWFDTLNKFRFQYVAFILLLMHSQRCHPKDRDLQLFKTMSVNDKLTFQLSVGSFSGSTTLDSDVDVTMAWGTYYSSDRMTKLDAYDTFLQFHNSNFDGSLQDMFDINVYGVGFNQIAFDANPDASNSMSPLCRITDAVDNNVTNDVLSMSYVFCKLRAFKYVSAVMAENNNADLMMSKFSYMLPAFGKLYSNDMTRFASTAEGRDILHDVDHPENMRSQERRREYERLCRKFIDELELLGYDMVYDEAVHRTLSLACIMAEDQYYTCSTFKDVVTLQQCSVTELYQSMWENFGLYARYSIRGNATTKKQCKYLSRWNKARDKLASQISTPF